MKHLLLFNKFYFVRLTPLKSAPQERTLNPLLWRGQGEVSRQNKVYSTLHILFWFLLLNTSFAQTNDQCYGPNIGTGSLYPKITIGCVPFKIEIIKVDTVANGHKFIYDYTGGMPTNPTEVATHIYTKPGAYKLMQITFRKSDGKELRACGVVTVLDTNKLILKAKTCDKKLSLEITDNKKLGSLPYDFCVVDWGDQSLPQKIKLPTATVSHDYINQADRKITVKAHYEVEFCGNSSSVDVKFAKATQPQISVLEKNDAENYSITFNNQTGDDVKVLANNSLITSKNGEVGIQKILFSNTAKNVCYAIKIEGACFPSNVSKEICDIDFEVIPIETANELRWKTPKPDIIKGFEVTKNASIKISTKGTFYADTTIKCNQQHCYQIRFTSNETAFITNKICIQNSLIPCFVSVPLYLPLAFSPNNDGINDDFRILGEEKNLISLTIYDNRGKIITMITNFGESWNGENYASGVYPYRLKARNVGNKEVESLGKIMLVR